MDPARKAELLAKISAPNAAKEEADKFFEKYDTNKNGYLSPEEGRNAQEDLRNSFMKQFPNAPKLSEEQKENAKQEIMKFVKDGQISKEDFVKLIEELFDKLKEGLTK